MQTTNLLLIGTVIIILVLSIILVILLLRKKDKNKKVQDSHVDQDSKITQAIQEPEKEVIKEVVPEYNVYYTQPLYYPQSLYYRNYRPFRRGWWGGGRRWRR